MVGIANYEMPLFAATITPPLLVHADHVGMLILAIERKRSALMHAFQVIDQ